MRLDTRINTNFTDSYKVVENGGNLALELETAQEMLVNGFKSEGSLMIYSILIFPLNNLLIDSIHGHQHHYLPRIVYLLDQLYNKNFSQEINDLSKVILDSYLKTDDGKKYCRYCDESSVNQLKKWHLDQLHRYLLMLKEKIVGFKNSWQSAKYDQGEISKRAAQLHDEILKQSTLFSHDHHEVSYSQAYKNLLDPKLIESEQYRNSQGKMDLIEVAQVVSLERLLELSIRIKIYDLLPFIIMSALRGDYVKISNQAFTMLAEVIDIEGSFANKLILDQTRSLLNHNVSFDGYEEQVVLPLISTNKIIIE